MAACMRRGGRYVIISWAELKIKLGGAKYFLFLFHAKCSADIISLTKSTNTMHSSNYLSIMSQKPSIAPINYSMSRAFLSPDLLLVAMLLTCDPRISTSRCHHSWKLHRPRESEE